MLLKPIAQAALAMYATPSTAAAAGGESGSSSNAQGATPDTFLARISLGRLLLHTALIDPSVAGQLCSLFNLAAANAGVLHATKMAASTAGSGADSLLQHLNPDLHYAVLSVAAAQPPGCQLNWTAGGSRGSVVRAHASLLVAHRVRRLLHKSPGTCTCM